MSREIRDDQHGTVSGYYGHKCRCHLCMAAMRAYQRRYRAENREAVNEASRRSLTASRARDREVRYSTEASRDEVKQWVRGLGLPVNGSLTGRHADALIARYNREHPDRPYVRPSERTAS